jgi:hypothetical protein
MRIIILLLAGPSFAQSAAMAQERSVEIGPWRIEASYQGENFERCVMSRTLKDEMIEVQFIRDTDGLSLAMSSTRWRLERGKSYPVELAAGSVTAKADVLATSSAVSLPLTDKSLLGKLHSTNRLEVRGAGSTIRVPLDKSSAGLERLEACFAKNSTSAETNPFVEPSKKP